MKNGILATHWFVLVVLYAGRVVRVSNRVPLCLLEDLDRRIGATPTKTNTK